MDAAIAEQHGCVVILDLRTERYRVLNEAGSVMWRVLTGESSLSVAWDVLRARYQVEEHRLAADLSVFARQCIEEGLLKSASDTDGDGAGSMGGAGAAPAVYKRPSILLALRSLVETARSVRRDGFAATYARYERIPRGHILEPGSKALRAFGRAENLYVASRAPDDCLVRSLALFRFLNQSGVRAAHVIGVNRFPFLAHAWVECNGQPALQASVQAFTPLARI